MQKDIALKQLAEHEDVFAEIFNQLAFGGRQIVKPEELISVPTEAVIAEIDGVLREKRRDIVKADGNGQYYHLIFGLENQDHIDQTMPVRMMGYDLASYEKQIRQLAVVNQQEKRHVIDRLQKGQKLAPVISLVLYWGQETWESPRCLYDILDFSRDTEDVLKPLIPDYPINLVCMAKLTQGERERLSTDIRVLADYVACQNDRTERKNILQNHFHKVHHWKETLTALAAIAGDGRYKQMVQVLEEKVLPGSDGEEGVNMCEVLDDIFNDGREVGLKEGIKEGIKEGLTVLIKTCKEFGISRQDTLQRIRDGFAVSQEMAEEYVGLYW